HPGCLPRLDLVLGYFRKQGFQVIEGRCLRNQHKQTSASKTDRAAELLRFWLDPNISAIFPPWGGELLCEILPLVDINKLSKAGPKWISGFSDLSTLFFSLTTRTGLATLHSSNLMDLAPSQTDPLTNGQLSRMQAAGAGATWVQHSSQLHQTKWRDIEKEVDAPYDLTAPTIWKALQPRFQSGAEFRGRLIGGCLDTIARLAGTPFADMVQFREASGKSGVIFYFENCEMAPCELARTLNQIRFAGWLDGVSGILIGRSSGPEAKKPDHLTYLEALASVLGDLKVPVIYDADLGHRPPQLSILNGALGELRFRPAGEQSTLTQHLR
ncbi:MAG: S66 peptidase family protein, partial [Bdellovibrionota bacterium]